MGMRRRSRELALQVLFHLEYNPAGPEEAFDRVCGNFDVSPDIVPFARSLVTGVLEKTEEVHGAIVAASENWRFERMSRVDRCILRMAVLENDLKVSRSQFRDMVNFCVYSQFADLGDETGLFLQLGREPRMNQELVGCGQRTDDHQPDHRRYQ